MVRKKLRSFERCCGILRGKQNLVSYNFFKKCILVCMLVDESKTSDWSRNGGLSQGRCENASPEISLPQNFHKIPILGFTGKNVMKPNSSVSAKCYMT